MRVATCAAAAAMAGALVLPLLAAPALAVADPVTGYWTRTNTGAPVPIQAPSTVPEGGFWVSGDPAGPVAVSAIRASADAGSVIVGLSLAIADTFGTPKILVCPTTETWVAEQGGRLVAAPSADCFAPVEPVVEGKALLIALPAPLQTEDVDLLLTPAPGAAFSATFQRATAEAVVQAPAAPVSEPAPAPFPPTSGDGSQPGPPAFESGGFSGDFGSPDLGATVTAPEPLLPGPAVPAPAEAAVPQPQAAPAAVPAALAARRPTVPAPDRTASLMAVALLVLLAAGAVRLAVQPVAPPRHLGGGARLSRPGAALAAEGAPNSDGDVVGSEVPAVGSPRGVGRFRGPRLHPPVRI